MATFTEYREQFFQQRIARLERTPAELAAAIGRYGDVELLRRPDL